MAEKSLYPVANGHLSFSVDIHDEEEKDALMLEMVDFLMGECKFRPPMFIVPGLDGTYMDVYRGKVRITVAYDVWSGVFAMAYCGEGDLVVRQVAAHFA